jgi:hypothetical protein
MLISPLRSDFEVLILAGHDINKGWRHEWALRVDIHFGLAANVEHGVFIERPLRSYHLLARSNLAPNDRAIAIENRPRLTHAQLPWRGWLASL